MKTTNTKSLIIFSTLLCSLVQPAIAQNNRTAGSIKESGSRDIFGSDSTNLIPNGMIILPTNQVFSSSYSSVPTPVPVPVPTPVPTPVPVPTPGPVPVPTPVYNGICGVSNNSILPSTPTSFLCDKGTASVVTTSGGTYSWSCTGNNTGKAANVASCTAQQRVVGQCGSDNGKTLSSAPTSLCASGNPSVVSSSGTGYSWSCSGNYGTPASCSASLPPPAIAETAFCGMPVTNYVPNTNYTWTLEYKNSPYTNGWGISDNPVCPGGYTLYAWQAPYSGLNANFSWNVRLTNYTSDGTYVVPGPSYVPPPQNGNRVFIVSGLDALKTQFPNLKFGCPPNYSLSYYGCYKN